MVSDKTLKRVLKQLKEHESSISMLLGAIVVVAVAIYLFNSFNKPKTAIPVKEKAASTAEVNSEELEKTLPSITPESLEIIQLSPTPAAVTSTPPAGSLLNKVSLYILSLLSPKQNQTPTTTAQNTPVTPAYSLDLVKQADGSIRAQNLPAKYVVKPGDSLWKIAQAYYGSGYNFVDLASSNKLKAEQNLTVGLEIKIPDVVTRVPANGKLMSTVTAQSQPVTNVLTNPGTYQVKTGDSLWKIATMVYHDGYAWTKIYQANKTVIKSPGIIEAGWELQLPAIN